MAQWNVIINLLRRYSCDLRMTRSRVKGLSRQLRMSTMSSEECCCVCRIDVPKSTMQRRLYSEATKHVVPVLHGIGGGIFLLNACLLLILPNTDATFLCWPCMRDEEKLIRLRKEVSQLESQFSEHLTLLGEQWGLSKNAPTVPRTLPSHVKHTWEHSVAKGFAAACR